MYFQLLEMMDEMTRVFHSEALTTDLSRAQLMLQDHLVSYQSVNELYHFTCSNAQDILSKSGTSSSVNVSREEIKRFLDQSDGKREEWLSLWQHHQNKLQESVKLCGLEQAISKVHVILSLTLLIYVLNVHSVELPNFLIIPSDNFSWFSCLRVELHNARLIIP